MRVSYRYISTEEYCTPLYHIPIQRTVIDVHDGESIETAIRREYDFKNGTISDIESEPL